MDSFESKSSSTIVVALSCIGIELGKKENFSIRFLALSTKWQKIPYFTLGHFSMKNAKFSFRNPAV